jgi:hypothetical protein
MASSIELLKQSQKAYSVNSNKQSQTNAASAGEESSTAGAIKTDTLEISKTTDSDAVDSKADAKKANASEIEALQKQAEQTAENLKEMVGRLLYKQAKYAGLAGMYGKNVSETDSTSVTQASQAISDDGDFGVEAVSNRIVDFAVKVSGGDTTKLDELKAAIKKGFDQAGMEFGGDLPGISSKTYDAVMTKLDKGAKGDTSDTASASVQ